MSCDGPAQPVGVAARPRAQEGGANNTVGYGRLTTPSIRREYRLPAESNMPDIFVGAQAREHRTDSSR
eukprot:427528-Prymnesium_polylepis.1